MEPTLDELAIRHGTDKSSLLNAFTEKYEPFLAPRRRDPLVLLEIGIYGGASIRAWHDYFPNATIVGIDIAESCPKFEELAPRVQTFRIDQSDAGQLQELADRLRGRGGIDLVIDDGSHVSSHQITSFKTLFPALNPGGIYFVEDVTTSYHEMYGGGLGRPDTFLRFAQDLIPFIPMSMGGVPARHPWERDLDFVYVASYGGLVGVGKLSDARKRKILGHAGS